MKRSGGISGLISDVDALCVGVADTDNPPRGDMYPAASDVFDYQVFVVAEKPLALQRQA